MISKPFQHSEEILQFNKKIHSRAKQYRDLLTEQVLNKSIEKKKYEKQKLEQRMLLEQELKKQRQKMSQKKKTRIQAELKFTLENKKIMDKKILKTQQIQRYEQHPFMILKDRQQQRKRQIKSRCILSNQINDQMLQLKFSRNLDKKNQQFQQKKRYQQYVQSLFRKHSQQQKARKISMSKQILSLSGRETNINLNTPLKDINQKYLSYLIKESEQKRKLKFSRNKTQQTAEKNNTKNYLSDNRPEFYSSPFYIGQKIQQNRDRIKQLNMIDNKFGFKYDTNYQTLQNQNNLLQNHFPISSQQQLPVQSKERCNQSNQKQINKVDLKVADLKERVSRISSKNIKTFNLITGQTKIYGNKN